jgi:hypothetical protein
MKRILITLERNISTLPPLLTMIDSLKELYDVTVIAGETNTGIELYYGDSVKFISYYKRPAKLNGIFKRAIYKIRKIVVFKTKMKEHLRTNKYDLIIVGSAETALLMRNYLKGLDYILNIYELYDRIPSILKKIKETAVNAKAVIAPEIHRAHILKLWLKLKDLPVVMPNKPIMECRDCNQVNEFIGGQSGEKIILYQGVISRDRNIEIICKAVNDMDGYKLVLMGAKSAFLEYLLKHYPKIQHIDFVQPPFHLKVTSCAYIGIVTYDYFSLNTIFCAPNKIWEYSGFGIPMLANNIPGLTETLGKYKAGLCIDTNNLNDIKQAIIDIDNNYEVYKSNAFAFYDSCDIKKDIQKTVSGILS